MGINKDKLKKIIIDNFPDAKIQIEDMRGDQNHYKLTLRSAKFKNINKVAQHRMVYSALKEIIGKELHALILDTDSI